MIFRLDRLMAALALAACANLAHAAGFALIEQNASGLGNAYAGQAAAATDASTIFFNPAGMTHLPDRQLVLAGHLIKPKAEFSGSASLTIPGVNDGGNGGDAGGLAFVPNAYFAMRLNPDVHLGLGLNAPFGLKTEYDPTWAGSTHAVKSHLKTINLNPSVAWKASKTLSLGAGLNVAYAEAILTNQAGAAGQAKIQGDDIGWGFNLGALWQATPATRVGLAYRSEIDLTLEGSATFSGNPALNGPVTADVTFPDSASLSISHRVNDRWDVLADVTWTGWSDFDELRIVRASGATLSVTQENWGDSMRYSLGANYRYSDKWTLRGGVAYDKSPVPDAYRTARIPDEDRLWMAFGAQYRLSPKMVLDFGYAHLFVKDASIDEGTTVRLTGNYDASVDILSAQLTLNF
ncbi:MAG: OmpP1/FadL family transporter [Thiobacillus sp.]